jgi:hypothetical protein
MAHEDSPKPPPHRIDLAAKARFLKMLRAGASRKDAAAGSGFSWRAFYQVRRRDPIFEFGWLAAMELSAVDERDARRAAERLAERRAGGVIETGNRRVVQLKRKRRGFSFDERRQQLFLDYFAGTADEDSAADAAGVSRQTVRAHVRRNPEFAALREEALHYAYARLEAEEVRRRLAMQKRLRDNLEPTGEMAQEFERVMKLLARYDRKGGRIASRQHAPSAGRVFTFEQAAIALDKALDALAIPRIPFRPGGEEGSGGGASGETA